MLNLVYGRAGADLSGRIFSEIKQNAENGISGSILIVPRHYSHECERELCRVCGNGISLHAEVLTLGRLANRVFSEAGGIADAYLDEGGRLLTLARAARRISGELRTLGGHVRKPDFLKNIISLIDELKTNKVDITNLINTSKLCGGALGDKLYDLSMLCSAYDAEIGALRDPRELYDKLADSLRKSSYIQGRNVYVYGFTEFSAQELEILRVILTDCSGLTVTLECGFSENSSNEDIELFYGQSHSVQSFRRIAAQTGSRVFEEHLEKSLPVSAELSFLEKNLFTSENINYGKNCEAVSLYSVPSIWEECEQAAAKILEIVRNSGCKFRDIAVAIPESDGYRRTIEAVFKVWGIPHFPDLTDSAINKPIISALVSCVDIILNNYELSDMLRYIKAPLCPLDFSDGCKLENYAIIWDIRGRAWASEWTMNPRGISAPFDASTASELTRLNALRREVIAPFAAFREKFGRGEYSATEILQEFYAFLQSIGFEAKTDEMREKFTLSGDLKSADEHSQLWGIACDILDNFANILGDSTITLSEFSSFLRLILENTQVGTIPAALDGVAVGVPGRLRHRSVHALFLLGTTPNGFPPPQKNDSILSDANRTVLAEYGMGLEPASTRLSYRGIDTAYAALTLPSEQLFISWATSESATPSYLVTKIRKMFSLDEIKHTGDSHMFAAHSPAFELALRAVGGVLPSALETAAFRYFSEKPEYSKRIENAESAIHAERTPLSTTAVRELYGDKVRLTASRADKLSNCHFAYFMQYGLRAKLRAKAALDALESGNLLHFVLEKTVADITSLGGFSEIDEATALEFCDKNLNLYAETELGGLGDKSARTRFLFMRLSQTVRKIILNILEEMRSSKFLPLGFELSFANNGELSPIVFEEGNTSVELTGIIDRVDGWADGNKLYIRVVDYKSGYKKFNLSDIYYGIGLQMLVYMFALEQRGVEKYGKETVGAGVLYSPVKDVTVSGERGMSDDEIRKKVNSTLSRSGIILADPEVIEAMDAREKKCYIPVGLLKNGTGFTAASSVATLAQFGKLKRHVEKTFLRLSRELTSGSVQAKPSVHGGRSACEYCEFAAACQFDQTNGKDKTSYLPHISNDEFWDKIGEEQD